MKAIVLAAGKGTRLQSEEHNVPKVLREANGKPLLNYVLNNINFLDSKDIIIVVGYKADSVKNTVGKDYKYALQEEQLGTGHAVMQAEDYFNDYDGDVLVLYGDMPLFKESTYKELIEIHKKYNADCTILTSVVDKPLAYGRIIRKNGNIIDIVEQKDCSEEQKKIKELNVGIYAFKSKVLFDNLRKLENNNSQGEYYLTDIPKILIGQNKMVSSYTIENDIEIVGVNTKEDLNFVEEALKNGY